MNMKTYIRLISLASQLDEKGFLEQASELDKVVASLVEAKKTKEGKEPDVPKKVVEIADAIRRDNPDTSDEVSYRMAWETYVSYVNPSYEGGTSKGKSHRESPKSEYAKD
jgi:hypothetical protein